MVNRCAQCGREVIPAAMTLGFCPSCGNPLGAGERVVQPASASQPSNLSPQPPVISPIAPGVLSTTSQPQPSIPAAQSAPAHLSTAVPAEPPTPPQTSVPAVAPVPAQKSRGNRGLAGLLITAILLLVVAAGALLVSGKAGSLLSFLGSPAHSLAAATATSTATATATATLVPPTATPKPTVPPAPPGFKTFTNPDGTYGMNVPGSWTHSSVNSNDTISDSFTTSTTGEFVQVTESSTPITPSDIVSYLQSFVSTSNGSDFHVTQTAASVTINGNTWERAQGDFTFNGQGQAVLGLAINSGGHGYVFIYSASVTSFNTQSGSSYDQIVSSFTFLG